MDDIQKLLVGIKARLDADADYRKEVRQRLEEFLYTTFIKTGIDSAPPKP